MKLKEILIAVFTLALVGVVAYLWFSPSGVKSAPNVAVEGINGHKVDIAQYRGHPLLVTFWATSCPGCVEEMPHLVKLYNQLSPEGFHIVAVAMSYDVMKRVQIMAQERHLPYTVAMDTSGNAAKAFGGVQLTPTSFLIDPQGRIVERKMGNLDFKHLRERIQAMLTHTGTGA